MRLEADDVIDSAVGIVAPKLDDGIVFSPGARVYKPDGLQRAVAQGIHPAARHDLDRHAALEHSAVVKAVYLRFLRVGQLLDKGKVLVLIHRAVYIVCRSLVIARGEERGIHVHALKRHDRGDGVIEMQVAVRAEGSYLLGDSVARQRPGRDDDLALRYLRRLGAHHLDVLETL